MEIFLLFIVTIIAGIPIGIIYTYRVKREKFVRQHSIALRTLNEINSKYTFLNVRSFDMTQSYDNRNYYATISPKDYLTYQLVYKQKEIIKAINNAAENNQKMFLYQAELASACTLTQFDSNILQEKLAWIDKILCKYWLSKGLEQIYRIERKLFDMDMLKPVTAFRMTIYLHLTNIQGRRLAQKFDTFYTPEITTIIAKLQNKHDGYYLDPAIWQAICRVERGRVSNKIRFAVYRRDGNRCRKCGSTRNLEIDHIYPISKGGKTQFENLQTLCHRCNSLKSNFIEANAVVPRNKQRNTGRICPNCNIPLVKRHGSYGEFWGCQNYPRCRYTSNLP